MAPKEEVADFLQGFKRRHEEVGWLNVVNRAKNRDALIALGLTKAQREEIILSLTPEDYCDGPLQDEGGSGEVWVFTRVEEGQEIYIKLKLTKVDAPTCISFHPAEHPLRNPQKKGRRGRK